MLNWIRQKEFAVTEEHINLLKRMIVSWDNDAPAIDSLQPYGTMCPQCDIAKILGMKPKYKHEDGTVNYTEEQIDYMQKIHKETQIALQIFLRTGIMETGFYTHDGWYNWKKVNGQEA